MELPFQPIKDGRFVPNRIVELLLKTSTHDMNSLACANFTREERVQLAQLIGYSVGGFCSLSYVSREESQVASSLLRKGAPDAVGLKAISDTLAEERRQALREQLAEVKQLVEALADALGETD